MKNKIAAIVALSRWKEHLPFTFPLSLLGTLLGLAESGKYLDWRFITITLGNIMVVTYAFMINDIEDSIDDAKDPKRKTRNPIASKQLTKNMGYRICLIVALLTLIFYATSGIITMLIGSINLTISHFYSWRIIRLKAYAVLDIVSHVLMLSSLLVMASFSVYSSNFRVIWPIIVSVALVSAYGQLYNQIRDLKSDKQAGLTNTAVLIGERYTRSLMYLALAFGIGLFGLAIYKKMFPFWLILPIFISIPAVYLYRTKSDMRGSASIDITGNLQAKFLLIANITLISWLTFVIVQLLL